MKTSRIVSLPAPGQTLWCALLVAVWILVTVFFVGLRPEHLLLGTFVFLMFFLTAPTRRLLVALLPFIIFGVSYDWMNLLPNYEVNPIDVEGLYNAEKSAFGINTPEGTLTPNEFFALHTFPLADFFAGIFYLCWVPLPVVFGLWLYFRGRPVQYLHFSLVFLLVNLIGFGLYYVHPAAPPWYVAQHGFEAVVGTPGSVAGLGRFDEMTGLGIFDALYARNSNVFAAIPSLHSAYTLIAFIYAMRYPTPSAWRWVLGVVTVGIWLTAVYSSHHYVIDVVCGIATAVAGILIFEYGLMRIPAFARFVGRYARFISQPVSQSEK